MRVDCSVSEIVELTGLTQGNNAVGKLNSGKTVFVEKGVPGEIVEIEITKDAKRYCEARIVRILEPSLARVTPRCPFYAQCGGCPWMQVAYEEQLAAKRTNVVEQLIRIGGKDRACADALVEAPIASKREFNYRNKIELQASYHKAKSNQFELGFHHPGSSDIVETKQCLVAAKPIEKSPAALRGALRYAQGNQDLGIFRVGVRASDRTKSTEIALWTTPGPFPRARVASILQDSLKATSVVRVMANPGKARKIKGVEVLAGKGYWEEKLLGLTYKVSAPSFFQVNSAQAEAMIKLALDGLALGSESYCADLYCGSGTFTLPMAELCGEVFAVESQASSVRDLRRNLEVNNLFAEVIGGDTARELPELGELDGLVVDPPRVGLAPSVPGDIAATGTKRFAYVSCNPSTWARDVALIEATGYRLVSATPVDLFPQTYHIETVSIFEK
jgi:23S rRNA (uracil1939-C5)-methyltransferase